MASPPRPPNVLMFGTGEYTTGYVHGERSDSDKGAGVVALTMFDLRKRGKVGKLAMCGTQGAKFAGIRAHLAAHVAAAYPRTFTEPERDLDFVAYPPEDSSAPDPLAYRRALRDFARPGDIGVIFTPDDTHYAIAKACIERGVHVLVTKPATKTLAKHIELAQLAASRGVLAAVEVHKRLDPMYADARDRLRGFGPLSFACAYMSQPKHQLETFKGWAGRSSDISYYLNAHHVDFHVWAARGLSRPTRVVGRASTGLASARPELPDSCEDTITLAVDWEDLADGSAGHATYTASWAAPRADVHSQQRFFYLGRRGELSVDQAHRGYTQADDSGGFQSVNPLFMKYTPSDGRFAGQGGYGYRSFEAFVDAVAAVRRGECAPDAFDDGRLATLGTTAQATAILEAGRRSLDADGAAVRLLYDAADRERVVGIEVGR